MLGRRAVKQAICAYQGNAAATLPEIDIGIGNDLLGAPYCTRYPVNVTLSHCGEAAIALASHRAVRFGIDLEAAKAFCCLSDYWFEDGEVDLLACTPAVAARALGMGVRRGLLWVCGQGGPGQGAGNGSRRR
ncbi:MAG: hypothetical protein FD153_1139, partial [Rhodospirillaceae bacterium]